jgi:RNA polymerase sigma-70 factor (sigma-E family)
VAVRSLDDGLADGPLEGLAVEWVSADTAPDAGVLEATYRQRYGRLVAMARLLVDEAADAEELVQEAFARTWARDPALADIGEAAAYVRRVVINLARDTLRRRARARRLPDARERSAPGADGDVLLDEEHRRVAAAVRALPRRQRECVVLRHLLGCSTAETASTLGIAEGSVKSHLSRALTALGRDLEEAR